ncbi:MAG: adenylate/guanylate cyclase domain-containing protein, partial [Caldimonas sp.]
RLGELMNEYYAHLFVPVERSKGVVADVVGDSMVAVWARTTSDIDVRRSACEATLEIARSLDRFNDSGGGDRPPLLTRFGLHSGDMLFGNIGASGHYEYRAVGDIVNTASRIQGLNKVLGTHILASAETVQDLDDFLVRPLGSFLLAGKSKSVSLVELVGRRDDPARGDESARHAQFAAALDAYEQGRWQEAAASFARILDAAPEDGPARFYAAHCERLRLHPPGAEWKAAIRIDSK